MNGFVLHVNNNLENQFSTKKTPSIAAKPYFSSRAYYKFKTLVAASRNIAWLFYIHRSFSFISVYKLFSQNEKKKISIRMSWSHSCLRWNTRMAPVSGRPPKLTKRVLSADDFFIVGISLNDLAEQARLCLLFIM